MKNCSNGNIIIKKAKATKGWLSFASNGGGTKGTKAHPCPSQREGFFQNRLLMIDNYYCLVRLFLITAISIWIASNFFDISVKRSR